MGNEEQKEEGELVSRIGPLEIDWPRSIGYFGAIGLAVGLDLIAPPLGLFIAAVPFLKLLKGRDTSLPVRAVAAVLEGAAKPVGGDSDSVVRRADRDDEGAPQGDERKPEASRESGRRSAA